MASRKSGPRSKLHQTPPQAFGFEQEREHDKQLVGSFTPEPSFWWPEAEQRQILKRLYTSDLAHRLDGTLDPRAFGVRDGGPVPTPRQMVAKIILRVCRQCPAGEYPGEEAIDEEVKAEAKKPNTKVDILEEWEQVKGATVTAPTLLDEKVRWLLRSEALRRVARATETWLNRQQNRVEGAAQLEEAIREQFEHALQNGDETEDIRILRGPEFIAAAAAAAEQDHLIVDLGLAPGGVGLLTGPGGAGKSMFLEACAFRWAEGHSPISTPPALKVTPKLMPSRPLRIVHISAEDPLGEFEKRRQKISPTFPENLVVFCKDRRAFPFLGLERGKPNAAAFARLKATLKALGPQDLVIMEPLIKFHQAEENSTTEMRRWLNPLRDTIFDACGGGLLIGHHWGWSEERGRGTRSLQDWGDFELTLHRTGPGGRVTELKLEKANFVASGWSLALAFDPATYRYTVAPGAGGPRCTPEQIAAWLRDQHQGVWVSGRSKLYAAVNKTFNCGRDTAEEVFKKALSLGLLSEDEYAGPIRVAGGAK